MGGTGGLGAGGGHKASGRCKGSSTERKRSRNSAGCNSATRPALTSHQGKLHLSNCNITGKIELGKKGRNINLPLLLFSESSDGKSRLKGLEAQSCYFCLETSHKKGTNTLTMGELCPGSPRGPVPSHVLSRASNPQEAPPGFGTLPCPQARGHFPSLQEQVGAAQVHLSLFKKTSVPQIQTPSGASWQKVLNYS